MTEIVLASKSRFRVQLLENAGLEFTAEPARIDERSVEEPLNEAGTVPADIAEVLAIAKADNVSTRKPGALVIGCDQVLALDGQVLHKPADMEEARRRLLALSGRTHQLYSAVALVRDGELQWTHVEEANITFRKLTPEFIGRHLAHVGEIALSSVGAYQVEGRGVQLMEKVEGDYFSIIGLPLLPLLAELRTLEVIDA